MRETVTAYYRDPFTLGTPEQAAFPAGLHVSEMAERMPGLPADFARHGVIRIDGEAVPREVWPLVRPKAWIEGRPVIVTFHASIRGGGEDGGKSGIALIGALVIAIGAAAITGGAAAGVLGLGLFEAGSTSALIAATAVSLIGGLILTALTPPPTSPALDRADAARDSRGAASAGGNVIEPNGPLPRVLGTRKIFPPLAFEPFVYFDGQDERVEAVYALAGPHDMSDIRVDGTPIAEAEDIAFEVREGWSDDAALTITTRQSRTAPLQLELSAHTVTSANQAVLESTGTDDVPKWHPTSGRFSPDEIQLHLPFLGGLSKDATVTTDLRVPFRIRIRLKGAGSWTNLPEFHYQNATLRQTRALVRLIFQAGENTNIPSVPIDAGWTEARKLATGQSVSPATSDWTAASYFSSGAGNDYLTRGTEGTTKLKNVTLVEDTANVYLDTATFTPGIYEVEIKRGCAFIKSSYSASAYTYGGTVLDFFRWRDVSGNPTIAQSRSNIVDTVHLLRSVSVWNEHPVQKAGMALIAIKAINRRVERVSVLASGKVKDWDGSGWNTWTTTSNPAPHYYDVLTGSLNLDPLPDSLIDTTSLTDWRTACTTLDYTCDHIAEGERVADTLQVLAGCGFARPYQSELWGVVRDFDRSAETPIQIFSPRNSAGFKWARAFNRLPDGLRVNFQSDVVDFSPAQSIVYRDDVPGPQLEQVTYQGLVTLSKARRRASFDLDQAKLRATVYTLQAAAEAIVAKRGSLVAVNHDVLETQAGFGRIETVQTDGAASVTGVSLDGDVPVWNETNMHAVADLHLTTDMHQVGRTTSAAVRKADGTITIHPLSNATGEASVLTFTTPVADDTMTGGPFDPAVISKITTGCLVVVGNSGTEYKRLVVTRVDPAPDLMATLTMVDEAQALWA